MTWNGLPITDRSADSVLHGPEYRAVVGGCEVEGVLRSSGSDVVAMAVEASDRSAVLLPGTVVAEMALRAAVSARGCGVWALVSGVPELAALEALDEVAEVLHSDSGSLEGASLGFEDNPVFVHSEERLADLRGRLHDEVVKLVVLVVIPPESRPEDLGFAGAASGFLSGGGHDAVHLRVVLEDELPDRIFRDDLRDPLEDEKRVAAFGRFDMEAVDCGCLSSGCFALLLRVELHPDSAVGDGLDFVWGEVGVLEAHLLPPQLFRLRGGTSGGGS
jgi:hypothetical protein